MDAGSQGSLGSEVSGFLDLTVRVSGFIGFRGFGLFGFDSQGFRVHWVQRFRAFRI